MTSPRKTDVYGVPPSGVDVTGELTLSLRRSCVLLVPVRQFTILPEHELIVALRESSLF
jgi:hypothetical protein